MQAFNHRWNFETGSSEFFIFTDHYNRLWKGQSLNYYHFYLFFYFYSPILHTANDFNLRNVFAQCLPVDANEWNRKLDKQQEKAPSKIDLLDERDCRELKIDGV